MLLRLPACPCSDHHLYGHLYTAVGLINQIESVQRWFTKRIKSVSNLSYDERSLKLENDRLELRRLRADLLMYYKIISHFVDIPQDDFFTIRNVKITRGNSFKLIVPNSRVDARADLFLSESSTYGIGYLTKL